MAFVCASFVLVYAKNFFLCAQLENKLFKKQLFKVSGLLEKWKFKMDRSSRKWCQSFVLRLCCNFFRLCFVCAAIFFVCATTILKLGAKTLLYRWNFRMVRLWRKWSQSCVVRLCWQDMRFFFDCAQLGSKLWTKFRISRSHILSLWTAGEMKIQNGPVEP